MLCSPKIRCIALFGRYDVHEAAVNVIFLRGQEM
jgi:hypothetical protein